MLSDGGIRYVQSWKLSSDLKNCPAGKNLMERATGIEPAYAAWKAAVLPLNYARIGIIAFICDRTLDVKYTLIKRVYAM